MNIKRIVSTICAALCICTMFPAAKAEAPAPMRPNSAGFVAPTVTAEPVLVELAPGTQGSDVLRLQHQLAVMGFFFTAEDGKYGANTQNAIIEYEKYLRLLEQDEIDRMIAELEANKTPEPTASATPIPTPTAAPLTSPSPELSAEPSVSAPPVPTPSPTPAPTPATAADGIADIAIQELLFLNPDALYRRDIGLNSKGADALRVQRRLIRLNYLNDTPDGIIGINSENAIKAFQSKHDLNPNGIADKATQKLLFSDSAIVSNRPVYNQLYLGVSGDDVKEVQKQMRLLGFTNRKVNGIYDQQTQDAVKLYETYLHQLDMMQQGLNPIAPDSTTVPEEILNQQGSIQGDPEMNPYEVGEYPEDAAPSPAPSEEPAATAAPTDSFVPTGIMTAEMQERLLEEGIPIYMMTVQRGDSGEQVRRIQRRLYSLGYLTANGVDGVFGKGTENAVKSFQRRHKMPESGIADLDFQSTIFSEDALRSLKPYQIRISTKDQRVYVYTYDANDEYNVLVQEFICSTGLNDTPTPLGTFTNTGPGARWHYFKKFECWAQYAYYIDGDIMFHSVLYDEQDEATLRKGSVYALGSKASHGCVRLQVADAEWIYYNCAAGTTVIVY